MDHVPSDLSDLIYDAITGSGGPEDPVLDQLDLEPTQSDPEPILIEDSVEGSINISDVIAVIKDQDDQKISNTDTMYSHNPNNTNPQAMPGPSQPSHRPIPRAYTEITEQPAPKALRFRYECEGRSAGSIPGIRSTAENKTFPSIRVVGHRGEAFVVVSCVTKDPPYKPHPHNLVGRDCKTGVCTVKMTDDNMSITFNNLGIQCIRKKDIEEALKKREEIKVDPFKTGFGHRNQPSSIDLNAIRLCFQVFVSSPTGLVAIKPVISEPIFDKKAMSELVITKLSHCSASVSGGKEVILLCEKVAKEDIAVRFYEEQNGQVVWEANGDFQHNNVHKQVAISFKTPPYKNPQLDHVTKVFLQLKRPSDGATSDPVNFDYIPIEAEQMPKRKKLHDGSQLRRLMQDKDQQHQQQPAMSDYRQPSHQATAPGGYLNITDPIKTEPTDPQNFNMFGGYRVPQDTPSPQPPFGSPGHSPMHQQQYAGQFNTNNNNNNTGFPNIPETLQQPNLFSSPFPQQSLQPPSVHAAPVSPPSCLPVSLPHQQQQQQRSNANPFMQYPSNTQQESNQTHLAQQQWNIQSAMRPMNDLSSSTVGGMLPFQGHQQQQQQNMFGQQHQTESQSQSVPMNILLDSNDLSNLNDLLPNSAVPSLSGLEQDQVNLTENLTDSMTKMLLNNFGGGGP